MKSTEFSVEEEVNRALAALEMACKRLEIKDKKRKTADGSEAEGDSETQV